MLKTQNFNLILALFEPLLKLWSGNVYVVEEPTLAVPIILETGCAKFNRSIPEDETVRAPAVFALPTNGTITNWNWY
jgi:hypothetical protein